MPPSEKGVTLLELMTVLLLLTLLASMAMPSVLRWIQRRHLKTAVQDLCQNLQMAKNQAGLSNELCSVVFTTKTRAENGGYLLFSDLNGNLIHDAGEPVIQRVQWKNYDGVHAALDPQGHERLQFIRNKNGRPAVGFRPNGIPVCATGGLGMGSIYLSNRYGARMGVILSGTGRIRIREE